MDYIILDIEFNGRKFASDLPMEVIELGAVRLDSSLAYVDEFSSMIKPVYFPKLNSFLKKKTGIVQEEIDSADGFTQVIGRFKEWLDASEERLLVTWGGEDMKRIVFDTRMHKLDDGYWMNTDYFDLLKGYIRFKGVTNDVSVEAALADLEIDASGSAHRALDDARMTAEVFRAVFEQLDLSLKQRFKDTYSNAKERRFVKNAIRMMKAQKLALTWEVALEKFPSGKLDTENKKKMEELREYFEAEMNKQD